MEGDEFGTGTAPGTETVEYTPSAPSQRFHSDVRSPERLLWGPLGCGKTYAMMWDLAVRAQTFPPCVDGLRHVRYLVIRNTYRELADTTVRVFKEIYEGPAMSYNKVENTALVRIGDVEMEVVFRALDVAERDKRKILSTAYTAAVFNELSEISEELYSDVMTRCGRYPPRKLMALPKDCERPQAWMISDTNPTDEDHWVYRRFYANDTSLVGCAIFCYPGGLETDACNLENLPAEYYRRQMAGRSKNWLTRYRDGRAAPLTKEGAVFPDYNDELHGFEGEGEGVRFVAGKELFVGIDFGMSPAAVFLQKDSFGCYDVISELCAEEVTLHVFGPMLNSHMTEHGFWGAAGITMFGDPSGEFGSERSPLTSNEIVAAAFHGTIRVLAAPTNDMDVRKAVVSGPLSEISNGRPRLMVDRKNARMIRSGLMGNYCYAKSGKVLKNQYSHPMDALQYALMAAGEDQWLLRRKQKQRQEEEDERRRAGIALDGRRIAPPRPRASTVGVLPWD